MTDEAALEFDESGWAAGVVAPMDVASSFSLFAKEPSSRMEVASWAHAARRFFDARLELHPAKKYEGDAAPSRDRVVVEIEEKRRPGAALVELVTLPLAEAPRALEAAVEGTLAIGGAGMDALLARATRVWQIAATSREDRAALLVAAVLASVLLAPIVPPGGGTIFGVKGARERLGAV